MCFPFWKKNNTLFNWIHPNWFFGAISLDNCIYFYSVLCPLKGTHSQVYEIFLLDSINSSLFTFNFLKELFEIVEKQMKRSIITFLPFSFILYQPIVSRWNWKLGENVSKTSEDDAQSRWHRHLLQRQRQNNPAGESRMHKSTFLSYCRRRGKSIGISTTTTERDRKKSSKECQSKRWYNRLIHASDSANRLPHFRNFRRSYQSASTYIDFLIDDDLEIPWGERPSDRTDRLDGPNGKRTQWTARGIEFGTHPILAGWRCSNFIASIASFR